MKKRKQKYENFYKLLEKKLNVTIQRFETKELSPDVLREMRNSIKEDVATTLSDLKAKLDNNSIIWITDQYFKNIQVGDDQVMTDLVVLNEYRLNELSYHDVRQLLLLMKNTTLAKDIEKDILERLSKEKQDKA